MSSTHFLRFGCLVGALVLATAIVRLRHACAHTARNRSDEDPRC